MQVTHSTTFRPRTKDRFGVKNDDAKLDKQRNTSKPKAMR